MCNFGGSSTNTNQIIRNPRDPNRRKLIKNPSETMPTGMDTPTKSKDKSLVPGMTASDTYQG